jgi:hypothetical protein
MKNDLWSFLIFTSKKLEGKSFLSLREFIWNEWFIFIFIDIYNFFLLFLNFTNILKQF